MKSSEVKGNSTNIETRRENGDTSFFLLHEIGPTYKRMDLFQSVLFLTMSGLKYNKKKASPVLFCLHVKLVSDTK
jgi:hypothetical protein